MYVYIFNNSISIKSPCIYYSFLLYQNCLCRFPSSSFNWPGDFNRNQSNPWKQSLKIGSHFGSIKQEATCTSLKIILSSWEINTLVYFSLYVITKFLNNMVYFRWWIMGSLFIHLKPDILNHMFSFYRNEISLKSCHGIV